MKITRHGLRIDEYSKFISNGYQFEVIPDYSSDDRHPDSVLIAMCNIQRIYATRMYKDIIEKHNFVVPITELNSGNHTYAHEHEAYITREHIKFSFTGKAWISHRCSTGILEVEITERGEDNVIHDGKEENQSN
ncbi:MAG: hypothetical protein NC548_28840 [Lachnospiraceae bacterium]|nr:hypothetical protein [Lachnospiraceae bacterium]